MPGTLLKTSGNLWWLQSLWLAGLLLYASIAFAQVEPIDALPPQSPPPDTTLQNLQFGTGKPGTTVDTMRIQTKAVGHSPRKAILFAAVLPGLGQAYNGKYWKIPIVYGGIMAVGYGIAVQSDRLSLVQQARLAIDRKAENENPLNGTRVSDANIDRGVELYNRNRDFMIIIMAGVYALSIADAIVDAHLKEFEVNEDLSFHIKPSLMPPLPVPGGQLGVGLALTLTFK